MSADPDDMANNPYNEGGAAAPTRQQSTWFCHSCQRDIPGSELRRDPNPRCPYCSGEFVEETGESADDPHQFDLPMNPFAAFMGPQRHQQHDQHPSFVFGGDGPGHQHQQQQQQQQDQREHDAYQTGDGPFGMLFHALAQAMGGGGGPAPQHSQQSADSGTSQTASPASAAAEAAQRQANNDNNPASALPEHLRPASQSGSASRSDTPSGSRPSSSGGVYRAGNATFVWSNSSFDSRDRPPPSSGGTTSQSSHADESSSSAARPPPNRSNSGPVVDLASFLQEAFRGGAADANRSSSAAGTGPAATSPLQEGPAQRAGDTEGPRRQQQQQQDPLMAMLGGLAGMFGVPLQGMQGSRQQTQQQPSQSEGEARAQGDGRPPQHEGSPQPTAAQPGQSTEEGQGQPGQDGQRRATQFAFGGPGRGAHVIFTFGGPPGTGPGEGEGGMGFMPFLPFLAGGQAGGPPGQMGDYVFSQGALDNIITELMNQAQGRYGPQPATEEIIKDLPTFKLSKELLASDTITDCAVCKDDFEEEEDILKLPCNHIFHADCIKPWLERSGTCPICRHQLVPQPEPPRNAAQAMFAGAEGDQASGGPAPAPGAASGPASPTRGSTSGRGSTSNLASPSLPRSPPIEGGSSMPGSFPFGNIFSTITGMLSGSVGPATSGSRTTGAPQESAAGRSPSPAPNVGRNAASSPYPRPQTGQSSQQSRSRRQSPEQRDQPDLDLDLD